MHIADLMRHNSPGRLWNLPAFGEVVAVTRPGPKKAPRGQVGHYLYTQTWTNRVTYALVTDSAGIQIVEQGLEP
eukprot:12906014-Prorocentrum_lima.AAC.1